MPSKTKVQTNGSKAEQPVKADQETTTEADLSVEPSSNLTELLTDLDTFTTEESSEPDEADTADEKADVDPEFPANAESDPRPTTTLVAAPIPLSKQEAIAAINTANHDLLALLEPLLKSPVTQKRLTELMVSRIGLPKEQADNWTYHVNRLLEEKQQASQSLVRSLIADS